MNLYTPEQIKHAAWYVRSYRTAIAKAKQGIKIQMNWAGAALDEAGLKAEFITALFRRIETKAGIVHKGRKWAYLYQLEQERDCRAIRDKVQLRIVLHQIATPELKRRFAHLISEREW